MSIRLNVPYREKDEAKALGAKWNFKEKYWYCEELSPGLRRWYEGDEEEVLDEEDELDELGNVSSAEGQAYFEEDDSRYKTVTQINQMIRNTYYETPEFLTIMVKGEVTNYSMPNGGNYYFAIKDENSLLPVMMWGSDAARGMKFKLEKGQQVAITGSLDYYPVTGKSQLRARRVINLGDGAANLAYIQLRERLKAEGLFDIEHKKAVPKHPAKIGIITSKQGQAIKDICKVGLKRNPYVEMFLFHVNVQGKNAVDTIVEGIQTMDELGMDALIVGRGGGSDEELIVYNDERVARAIFEAKTAVVTAVGHEGHWTLVDETADLRCATPSEAAETLCPDIASDIQRVNTLMTQMHINMKNNIERRKYLLQTTLSKIEKNNPEVKLKAQKDRLETITERLKNNMNTVFERNKHRTDMLITRLHGLSPTAKLVNGFGYIAIDCHPVDSVESVQVDDELLVTVHDGTIHAKVTEVVRTKIEEQTIVV